MRATRTACSWIGGDGTSSELAIPFGVYAFSAEHDYLDDNPTGTAFDNYTVTVTVIDDDGGTVSTSRSLTVVNEPPSLEVPLAGAIDEGSLFVLAGVAFRDRGRLDTHTATIEWGDGSTTNDAVTESGGNGIVTGTHVFANDGIYLVRITVRDDDGGEVSQIMAVTVANVPPSIDRLWTEGPPWRERA